MTTDGHDADVLIIGSGINGLVAAALLAREGVRPLVLEGADEAGGAIATRELTRPGFLHDVFSGWHPLFVSGDAYAELGDDLGRHGLEYVNTDTPTAVVTGDGSSAVLRTDAEQNAERFATRHEPDGAAWQQAIERFGRIADTAFAMLGTELWSLEAARTAGGLATDLDRTELLRYAGEVLEPSRAWLDRTLQDPTTRALLSPWVLHNGMGPDDAGSGLILQVITAALQQGGCPVPEGGGARLVDALVGLVEEHGGTVRTGAWVEQVLTSDGEARGVRLAGGEQLTAAQGVMASVTPQALYLDLLEESDAVPGWVRGQARGYRYGRGDMQVHLALDHPVGWPDDELDAAAIVHLVDGPVATSRAVNEAGRGVIPADPTVVVGQHTAVDPTRAPDGTAILWLQLQEMPSAPTGDAAGELTPDGTWTESLRERVADRVMDKLERALPGVRDAVLDRAVLSPADLAAANPNLVGGDPYAGACQLDQFLLWRPLPGLPHHRTPVDRLWHIGASTHPGPGLSGASGLIAAQQLLDPGLAQRAASAAEELGDRVGSWFSG